MFTKYKDFEFVSREECESSSILKEFVVKGTVKKIVKLPFCKEKTETVGVYLDGLMFWKFETDGKYTPDSVRNAISVWEMKNKKKLSTH